MDELQAIENYIAYLIGECGLSVTLHPMEAEALITFGRLMRFNTHDNSYCTRIKAAEGGWERCHRQQRRVFSALCERGGDGFSGVCHAGVLEYVYPLKGAEGMIGFISVSGYACEEGRERLLRTAGELSCPPEPLLRAYHTLKPPPADRARIDTLLLPLCRMLELAYIKAGEREESATPIRQMLRHIQRNYATDLRAEEICRQFGCSRSYFSHLFKRETGVGFREYLTRLRLDSAKRLLALSHLNVTEIAYAVGFNDANYFTGVFTKHTGLSPLAYRRQKRG